MPNPKSSLSSKTLKLFENNVAGIFETSIDGELITFNTAFAEFMGYAPDELMEMSGVDLYFSPAEREKFIGELLESGNVRNREVKYRRKDGSVLWCIENAYITDEGGQQTIIGTLTDISEQKINSERFQSLFYASGDAVFLLEDDKVIQANKRCCDIFGYSLDEFLGMDLFALTGGLFEFPLDKTELRTQIADFAEDIVRVCLASNRKDGSAFHSELTITRFPASNCYHTQVIVRDISERVHHEEALKNSEARFKLLSEVAIEGVVFVDEGVIRDCNQQFATLFGYKRTDDIIGRTMTDFIGERELSRIEQTLGIRSLNKTEVTTSTRDGDVLFLEATGSRIGYNNQNLNVFLFYNVTSRKRAEQELEQSTERFKSLVEHSPNGIVILTESRLRYINQSGLQLLKYDDEDDIYDDLFYDFFHNEDQRMLRNELKRVREGEDVEQAEYRLIASDGQTVVVSLKAVLTVYDKLPSIQVTLNNMNTKMKLMQETLRAQLAEEINVVLKTEIEEHKQTQRKLRQAENFTRNIIQSSIDMIIAIDNDDCITEFNTAAQIQFGYNSKEIIGKSVSKLYADQADFMTVKNAISQHQKFTGEIVNISKRGRRFTTFLSASIIRNDDGEPIGSMGVSRDVTEIKKAEQELRESEERYRDLFENAKDFIFSVDTTGRFIFANQAFLKAMGYSADQIKQRCLHDVVAGLKPSTDLLRDFAGQTVELDFIGKNGKTIKVYGDSSVKLKDKEPDSIRAIFRDITDLRKHEQAALEQAAKLESVFNSTENMLMWTMNLEGCLTSYNNNFMRWAKLDFNYASNLGDDILDRMESWINPDAYQNQLKQFSTAFDGEARQFELPLQTVNGNNMWFQVFINPVRVKDRMDEVSCLAYDITDRKEMDRKVLASLKEKEVLLKEVHHRVKNNLQVISSILNLQSSFVNDEKVLAILKESQSRIKTMSYIHETLYQTADFSSIEFTEYISSLVRNLIQSYAPQGTEVMLETDFDEMYLNLDQAIPCGLIINELVSNALKHAFKNCKKGTLLIAIKEVGSEVHMRIEDNGIGLPPGFRYEESESLGIYLVHALIEQIDAEMKVESDKGTRFLITFGKQA